MVLPVPLLCFLSTPLIMLVPVSQTTPSQLRAEELASSMACLTSTKRLSPRTALPVFIVVSFLQSLASLCTVVFTSVFMIRLVRPTYRITSAPSADLGYRTRCSRWCTSGFIPCILHARLGCHYGCRSCLVSSGHYSSSHDDDFRIYYAL